MQASTHIYGDMKTAFTVRKIGAESLSYNLKAARYSMTMWDVIDGKASKVKTVEAIPAWFDGVFGYKAAFTPGNWAFFPSEKDAGTKAHAVKIANRPSLPA